jgi:ribosomal protein S18 acetylase RimI-like enzyme
VTVDSPHEEVSIRHGARGDIPLLLDFWAGASENTSRPSDGVELIESLLDHGLESLLVAEFDGVVVGTLIAGWDGWRAHLYRLAVSPEVRGRGISRRLVEAAEERLRSLGAIRFDAMVRSADVIGESTWESLGHRRQDD